MSAVFFPAIVERSDDGFGIFFPDLPGCVSAGDTVNEAVLNGEEALSLHLAGMAEDRDPVPAPSSIDAIARDPDVNEVGRVLVRGELPGRSVRVQVTIDENLLSRIDRVAKNRSGFLADAARMALAAREAA